MDRTRCLCKGSLIQVILIQVRVLREQCTWQLINAERFRERAAIKDSEQLTWVRPTHPS